MPTAALTYDNPYGPTDVMRLQDEFSALCASLADEGERQLRAALAKLAPGDRRLMRAEFAPITQRLDHDPTGNTTTLVLEQDPPKVWTVERGGPEDTLDAAAAAALVRAGAGPCLFGAHAGEPCPVSLCDACHPESWATDTVPAR